MVVIEKAVMNYNRNFLQKENIIKKILDNIKNKIIYAIIVIAKIILIMNVQNMR